MRILCAAFVLSACGSGHVPSGDSDADASSSGVEEPTDGEPACGNGRREADEACDLGIGNEVGTNCTSSCTLPACGDALLAPTEECDDGNATADDGCSPTCLVEGRPLWSVTADGDERYEALWDLVEVDDGIVAVGTLKRSFYDSLPLIVSFGGPQQDVRWRRALASAQGQGIARRVLAVESDVVVAGMLVDEVAGPRPFMARFGDEGQLRYSRVLDIADGANATGMIGHGHERALVVGDNGPSAAAHAWVAEIDLTDASIVWQAEIGSQHELSNVDDLAAVADGWVVAGRLQGQRWIGRYDASWAVAWEQTFAQDYDAGAIAIAGDADGRVFAAGARPIPEPRTTYDFERWIVALEADGTIAWEVSEPALSGAIDAATDIALDGDGGVWVSGHVQQQPLMASSQWDVDAWIQRYDRDGAPTDGYTYDGRLHGVDGALGLVVTAPDRVITAGVSNVLFEGDNPWIASFGPGDRPAIPHLDPPPAVDRAAHPRIGDTHRATLFIDFDGRELRPGDWGTHGELPCLGEPIQFPGFRGTRAEAQLIVRRVEALLSPYGIAVHWKRRPPAQLPYTTVVVGGLPEHLGLDARVNGFACVTDCSDAWARDLAFAFDGTPSTIAMNVAHEAAHTWGLDHEQADQTVMQPFVGPSGTWSTECVPVTDATSDAHCEAANLMYCPSGRQNSDAVLAALFGGSAVDDQPPGVEILAPESGSVHPLGDPVSLEVDVTDDRGNAGFRVAVDALQWSRIAVGTETRFDLALPEGVFEIRIEAVDHGGNETRRSVTVEVAP